MIVNQLEEPRVIWVHFSISSDALSTIVLNSAPWRFAGNESAGNEAANEK